MKNKSACEFSNFINQEIINGRRNQNINCLFSPPSKLINFLNIMGKFYGVDFVEETIDDVPVIIVKEIS